MTLRIVITITFPPEAQGPGQTPPSPDRPPTPWQRLVAQCGGDRVAARRLTCAAHQLDRSLSWEEAVRRALLRHRPETSR
jgi:hypothetical protein